MNNNFKQIKKAILPVAGYGSRFLPATKSIPKEMLPILNKPVVQYAFEEARKAGIEEFIFITGRNKNAINNHFDSSYELEDNLSKSNKNELLNKVTRWLPEEGSICFVRQRLMLGLANAIYMAKKFVGDEDFIVILPDEMIDLKRNLLSEMLELYYQDKAKSSIIAVNEINIENSYKYGMIDYDKDSNIITDLVEKPSKENSPSNLSISGRYIFKNNIFNYIDVIKARKINEATKGELQITDAIKESIYDNNIFRFIRYEEERFDCGSVTGLIKANLHYGLENKEYEKEIKEILKNINIKYNL